jgi:hypothetical protein
MRRDPDDGREVKPSVSQRREEGWEATGGLGDCDALVGGVLGKTRADAVRGHRPITGRQVELARLELGEMSDDQGHGAALAPDDLGQIAGERAVGEMRVREDSHGRDSAGASRFARAGDS